MAGEATRSHSDFYLLRRPLAAGRKKTQKNIAALENEAKSHASRRALPRAARTRLRLSVVLSVLVFTFIFVSWKSISGTNSTRMLLDASQTGPFIARTFPSPFQPQLPENLRLARARMPNIHPVNIGKKIHHRADTRKQENQNQHDLQPIALLDKKPTFYLHVGLPKTGTTFLQCSLCQEAHKSDTILLEDNLVYLGTCPHSDCGIHHADARFLHHKPQAFFPRGSTKEPKANPLGPIPHRDDSNVLHGNFSQPLPHLDETFVQRVNAALAAELDALVIFEGCHVFSNRHIQALAEFLLPHWNVHVFVAYRPLYQWLPSKYNSINKPGRNRAGRTWPNMTDPMYPQYVGAPILPFDLDQRGAFSQLVRDIEHYQMHPAEIVRDNFRRHFQHVHILPLHQLADEETEKLKKEDFNQINQMQTRSIDPMLKYFFCEALVKPTPNVCRAVRLQRLGATMPLNPSVALDYDILAVAAYERGLLPIRDERFPGTKRSQVVAFVKRRHERELNRSAEDFAQKCLPGATLQRLEQLSLNAERRLFSSNWTGAAGELHHQGFVKYHSKFCSIDSEKVLQDKGWRVFFASFDEVAHQRNWSWSGEDDDVGAYDDGATDDDDLDDDE